MHSELLLKLNKSYKITKLLEKPAPSLNLDKRTMSFVLPFFSENFFVQRNYFPLFLHNTKATIGGAL